MNRIVLVTAVLLGSAGLAYQVFTDPVIDRAEQMQAERKRLDERNEALAIENEQIQRQIVALRTDPRAAARRARREGGLARPGELVMQFGQPSGPGTMNVRLHVRSDGLKLAGQTVKLGELRREIEELHEDVPSASLHVEFSQDVGPLRREQVRQLVADGSFESVSFSEHRTDGG
jgi:cell division protein FtsB